ncbi:MAG: bifunctional folylpolyglutamate synthase/dihydrofolate synthase, partial [Muribaculaceae bacterium]
IAIDNIFKNPHRSFRCIHVAGTNGKGSVSHTLAAILQNNGYKVGLYTSPHLIDFRERIRVNGAMIPESYVVDFVDHYRKSGFNGNPSFFELTMAMAFHYFRHEKVDFAVIEVGLGGRLDSTNIINPELCVITNISFDHTQFLGNTLPEIASEKAGIIKPGIPVVIGEAEGDVKKVFEHKAAEQNAPIRFAQEHPQITDASYGTLCATYHTSDFGIIESQLAGDCQIFNANTILNAVIELRKLGINISQQSVTESFRHVCDQTGLMGRWMKLNDHPITICDTGHNTGGMQYIARRLKAAQCNNLRIVIGFVNDKDIDHILDMLPKDAIYYFTQALIPRAQKAQILQAQATEKGLSGNCYDSVAKAYTTALNDAADDDMVFVGGSTFIVADLLTFLNAKH